MSEFTTLREAVDTLAGRSLSPDFGDLKRRAARRGRRRVAVAVAGAVAFIAVGGGLAAGNLGTSDQPSPIGEPTTPSSESPTVQEEASVGERYRTLRKTLTSMPGWAVTDADPPALFACEGNWMAGPGGRGAGYNLGLSVAPGEPPVATATEIEGFTSSAQASKAADRLIANLTSCTAESWRSRPIGQTGAMLAFTDAQVVWVHHKGGHVATLNVATIDGPPPLAVQVEVADLIYSWFG